MTDISKQQAEEFLNTHPHEDIADVGGWPGQFEFERDIYDLSTGVDICQTPLPRKYKTILFMDTLEHLLDPIAASANVIASLEDGGWIFVTAPFSWEEHNHPIDTYRYTVASFRYLFRELTIENCWYTMEGGHPDMLTRERVSLIAHK